MLLRSLRGLLGTTVLVALALAAMPRPAVGQAGMVFCVIPKDTSWRPIFFGYETENEVKVRGARVTHAYPIIRNVSGGSPADSAGIRDGDQLRAINGHDLVRQYDSVHVKGPGVPTRLTIGRGDTSFERTLVGLPARPCPDSLKRARRASSP